MTRGIPGPGLGSCALVNKTKLNPARHDTKVVFLKDPMKDFFLKIFLYWLFRSTDTRDSSRKCLIGVFFYLHHFNVFKFFLAN